MTNIAMEENIILTIYVVNLMKCIIHKCLNK